MAEKLTGLYICHPCKSVDEIPDYNPANADNDPRIGFLVEKHLGRHRSFEDRLITEWCALASVETKHWDNPKTQEDIKKQMLDQFGLTGLDSEFYDTQNTFKQDALTCYQAHRRPDYTAVGCQDYLSGSKEIKPNTSVERKAAGIPSYDQTKVRKSYLCEFCPYHAQVVSHERMKRS